MAWCLTASSHYLSQCWPRTMSPDGVTKPLNRWQAIILTNDGLVSWCIYIYICITEPQWVNTLRPIQNGRRFADDTFKPIFLNENIQISIKISLKFVPKVPINNIPALVQIMAWRRPGDKPLSEPMMVCLLTHICITRPQWVNASRCIPASINWVIIGTSNGFAPVWHQATYRPLQDYWPIPTNLNQCFWKAVARSPNATHKCSGRPRTPP